MSEKSKEKKFKKVPTIKTSINDVEFQKQLFKDHHREKFSEKYKTNLNSNNHQGSIDNTYLKSPNNHSPEHKIQIRNDISSLNVTNSTENNIRDFNKNVFNSCDTEENDKVYEDYKERYDNKVNQNVNNLLSGINHNSINNSNEVNKFNEFINIKENIQDNYANHSGEFEQNPSFEEYKNPNSLMNSNEIYNFNPYDQRKNNNKEKINSKDSKKNNNNIKDLRKFYLNYNHLNTPGVYETTISNVDTEEEYSNRRSKYRLVDKNKINKSLKNSKLKYKIVNRSLPNIDLDNLISNRNENPNLVDYNLTNRTIKIPIRYLYENSKNSEILKKFKQMTPEEEEECRVRIWGLLQNIYNFIEESKLDPILETFKTNEILKEFFIQRILELIANIFDSEKEMYIQKLIIDRREFEGSFKDTQITYEELNSKLNFLEENLRLSKLKEEENTKSFVIREENLIKLLNEKESKIKNLLHQLDYQEKEFNDLCSKFSEMNKDFENFKAIHDRIICENNHLKSKIKVLEDENNSAQKRYKEFSQINEKYEEENATLTKQLNQFREDYEIVKSENEKIKMEINKLVEENFSLNIKLDDKNKFVDEIMDKYDNGKKMSEEKITKYEAELDRLNKKILIMEETIKNTYKVKNAALKSKLKEKVELLEKNVEEFENYKKDKEKLITKMLNNHQSILNEKNQIIEELMRKK